MSDFQPLQNGETVTYQARLHWILFAPPLALFVGGLAMIGWQPRSAIGLLLASAVAMVATYVKFASTEIVITDARVIYRTGLIGRKSIEMRKDRIESIDVSQSVLGRILDFGAVTVKGTGGGIEALQNVAAPFEVRGHVAAVSVAQ